MESAISVKNLVRDYNSQIGVLKRETKRVQALKSISFDVTKGEIFGLLGQNGAGKTTTIKILSTLLAPTAGEARVLGYKTFGEEKQLRPYINSIFGGERGLYWRLSGRDNLDYFSDLYKIDRKTINKRIPELLNLVGLEDRQHEKVETYSKGMKQRLMIARGLVNDPEVIFLDEPTIGLDPVGARDLRRIIKTLAERGKTILLTTHYMYEADELCDRIGIINKGELVALDTPEKLKSFNSDFSVIEIKTYNIPKEVIEDMKNLDGALGLHIQQQGEIQLLQLQCKNCGKIAREVMRLLDKVSIINMNIRESTLEDAYLKLVGGM